MEERIECVVSKKVKYSKRDDNILTLPVPLEAATNKGKLLLIIVSFIYVRIWCTSMFDVLQLKLRLLKQRRKN